MHLRVSSRLKLSSVSTRIVCHRFDSKGLDRFSRRGETAFLDARINAERRALAFVLVILAYAQVYIYVFHTQSSHFNMLTFVT